MNSEVTPSNDFKVVSDEFHELKRKFNDPVFIGSLLSRVAEERTSFNLVLKEINAKLDKLGELEERIAAIESRISSPAQPQGKDRRSFISEVDADILKFVAHKGVCTAGEVQRKFRYKGANGASARLNNLYKSGLLDKRQAGKKVVFFPKS
ncbi:MAG: hypothetical protein V1717_04200 [Candidatus Micrarchaeota archaeon]